ncbi:TetR/AcrR family transcriptional regulator [Agromyces marinus]|uniref:TetR/AcrR family transcriptional regulator n=1 Tax=Agromyces marinus TaxID=1389020 RepID=UPI001F1AE7CC|nr:TetR/AcrR family transcriptional regulator [Agromyces marinus]UIP59839.1 HTH-type transcriptional regulator BetI [Agromyces marinus]
MATRLDPAERREQIIAATMRLVARDGFARVTLRDVAAEVGVVHGLIRHYFSTREQLVAEAFEAAVIAEEEEDEELATSLDPIPALADWLTTTPRDHYLVWVDAWSEAPRNPDLHAALARHQRESYGRLAGIIRRLVAAGHATSADPDADARELTAVIDGIAVQHHALGLIDEAEADRMALGVAEARLRLAPGTLARVRPTPEQSRWAIAH